MANIFPKSSLGDSKYIASRWTYAHWTEWMFQTFPLVTYSQAQNGPCQVWRSGWARRIVVTCIWHGVDRKWRCRSLDNIRGQAYSGLEATRKQLPDMTKGRQLKEYMVCGGTGEMKVVVVETRKKKEFEQEGKQLEIFLILPLLFLIAFMHMIQQHFTPTFTVPENVNLFLN